MSVLVHEERGMATVSPNKLKKAVAVTFSICDVPERDVAIVFVDEERGRDLNKRYRGRDTATNVLSFSNDDEEGFAGEVVLTTSVVTREAQERALSVEEYTVVLVVHGVLHLIGYDHEASEEEAHRMEEKEREILEML